MGLVNLMETVRSFIEEDLKEMRLKVKQENWNEQPLERPINVFSYMTPNPSDNAEVVPYILLQLVKGEDGEAKESSEPESVATIRGYIALFDYNAQEGQMAVISIIEKLRLDCSVAE